MRRRPVPEYVLLRMDVSGALSESGLHSMPRPGGMVRPEDVRGGVCAVAVRMGKWRV
jgi:hypothetical protein